MKNLTYDSQLTLSIWLSLSLSRYLAKWQVNLQHGKNKKVLSLSLFERTKVVKG